MSQLRSDHEPGERHVVLRIISVICTWNGVFLLVVGSMLLAFALYGLLAGPTITTAQGGGTLVPRHDRVIPFLHVLSTIGIVWALGILGAGLQFLAMGALFRLAIHMEENTRTTARCLEKLCSRLEPKPEITGTGPRFVS